MSPLMRGLTEVSAPPFAHVLVCWPQRETLFTYASQHTLHAMPAYITAEIHQQCAVVVYEVHVAATMAGEAGPLFCFQQCT